MKDHWRCYCFSGPCTVWITLLCRSSCGLMAATCLALGLLEPFLPAVSAQCSHPGLLRPEHSSVVKCQQTSNHKNHVGIEWAGCSRWARTTESIRSRCAGKEAEPFMRERIWTMSFDPGRNLNSLPCNAVLFTNTCVSEEQNNHIDITRKRNEDRVVQW